MKTILRWVVSVTAIIALLGLTACGVQSPEEADGGKKIRVGASLLTQSHPFYVKVKEAMEKQAVSSNVDLDVAIADQDLNKQISQVEDFINKGVDAIVISPVDSDGIKGAILKAQAAKIPVVTVDVPANGVEPASHVATDNLTGGKIAAEAMAQYLGGKGEIGVITYPEVQSVRDRIEGFKATIARYPNMTIVKETPGRDRQAAKAAAEDMLTSNPNIAGIFGFGDDMALAATQAVGDAKSDAIVIGFDGMDEALAAVDGENAFRAVVRQYPDKMGSEAIKNAKALVDGQSVEKVTPVTPGLYVEGKGDVPVTIDGDNISFDIK